MTFDAYCIWHYSIVTLQGMETSWRVDLYSHIRATIRSTAAACQEANDMLGAKGFEDKTRYMPHHISLERCS